MGDGVTNATYTSTTRARLQHERDGAGIVQPSSTERGWMGSVHGAIHISGGTYTTRRNVFVKISCLLNEHQDRWCDTAR
jgi:hypothetical protein